MKNVLIAFMLLLPQVSGAAEFGKLQLGKSRITFLSRQMGVPVEGVFKKIGAEVSFNPAKPEVGLAKVTIELASIDTGSAEANEEVKDKSWFDVAQFPRASFVASSVRPLGGGMFEAIGKMTLKGKTVEMRAPFTFKEEKGELHIDGVFALKRLEFGIGSGLWSDTSVVADDVQIKFHLVLM